MPARHVRPRADGRAVHGRDQRLGAVDDVVDEVACLLPGAAKRLVVSHVLLDHVEVAAGGERLPGTAQDHGADVRIGVDLTPHLGQFLVPDRVERVQEGGCRHQPGIPGEIQRPALRVVDPIADRWPAWAVAIQVAVFKLDPGSVGAVGDEARGEQSRHPQRRADPRPSTDRSREQGEDRSRRRAYLQRDHPRRQPRPDPLATKPSRGRRPAPRPARMAVLFSRSGRATGCSVRAMSAAWDPFGALRRGSEEVV